MICRICGIIRAEFDGGHKPCNGTECFECGEFECRLCHVTVDEHEGWDPSWCEACNVAEDARETVLCK